jgi:nucleoside-diphosphate-sugar epimerase
MNSMKGKRITIIGGAGFIGHNMGRIYHELGANVTIIDGLQVNNILNFSSSESNGENIENYRKILYERINLIHASKIELKIVDARDYHALSRALTESEPEVIVHLAAVSHANKSNRDPHSTFDHSLRTLENALDYSRYQNVKHFIYFSSSMVYGDFKEGKVDEQSECNPKGIYGALKFAGEKMIIAYNQVFDLPYTIVRPSALYGERCVSRRVGQIFIENALNKIDISVNGDGNDRLDFTYINDLVEGVRCIICNAKSQNEIFNITYGESRSISDLADIVKSHFPEIVVNYLPKDNLTPDRGTLIVDKAKSLIGYEPKFPLDIGFNQYIDWYKKFW